MNRRRTPEQILASHSAGCVKRQRLGRPSRSAARWAAIDRLRARLHQAVDRWAERTSARAGDPGTSLIGFDVAKPPRRLRTRSWAPLVAAAVLGALFLAVLRMDVIRMRFSVAQAFEEGLRLEELKRELTVDMRQLRDPAILAHRARELGFRPAERLIDLDETGGEGAPAPAASTPGEIELASAASDRRAGHRP